MANSNADSDTSLVVNSTTLAESCAAWKSRVSSVGLSNIDVSSQFSALINFGIGANYFSSLKVALERADTLATNISVLIDTVASDQEEVDDKSAEEASENAYGSAKYTTTTTKTTDTSSQSGGSSAAAVVAASSAGSYTVDNSDEDVTIKKDNDVEISKVDNDQEEVEVALTSIVSDDTPTEIEEPEEESVIKTTILEAPNISDDLKAKVKDMDESVIKVELYNLLESGSLVSDFSKTIIKIYDNDIKGDSEDATVYDSADAINKVYDFISKEKNFQEELREVYLGVSSIERVDDNTITLTRSFVDSLASTFNVSYEDILTDSKYQSVLLEGIEDLKDSFYLLSLSKETQSNTIDKTLISDSVTA